MISKAKHRLILILNWLFPMWRCVKANITLNSFVESVDEDKELLTKTTIVKDLDHVNEIKDCSKALEDSYEKKQSLEAKAKTLAIALTIAFTLMLSRSSLLDEQFNRAILNFPTAVFLLALSIWSVLYALLAALYSIKVFTKVITVYQPEPNKAQDKEELLVCVALNRWSNLIRNNYLSTSYELLRMSLICLFVVFVISVLTTFCGSFGSMVFLNDSASA